jgi:uncharacterized protein YfaP (DUF2135 family)
MKRLFLFLMIVVFVLAGCGGKSDQNTDNTGNTGNTGNDAQTQDNTTIPADAIDKGTLEYNQTATDQITSATESHKYEFAGANGDVIIVRVNATGSAFSAPYAFLYGPNGDLLGNSDLETSSRSSRVHYTITEDGTYTVIVKPVNDRGIEGYQLTVQK